MAKFSTRDIRLLIFSSSKSISIKNLSIEVETIKTLSATPNIANITVYGLAKKSRDFLTSLYTDENPTFTIEAIIDNKTIFSGEIVNARSTFDLGTWETKIFGNDGYNAYRATAKIETKKGDSRASALDSLFSSLTEYGLNEVDVQAIKNTCGNKSLLKRIIYDGNIIDNIKKLIKDCLPDTDVFIDNDKLNILPKTSTLSKNTELTQFLAPPQLNEQGCRATVLINSDIQIGGTITLKAKSYNQAFGNLTTNRAEKSRFSGEGTYKVIEISHKVDNFSKDVAKTDVTGIFI